MIYILMMQIPRSMISQLQIVTRSNMNKAVPHNRSSTSSKASTVLGTRSDGTGDVASVLCSVLPSAFVSISAAISWASNSVSKAVASAKVSCEKKS